jgi:hypothetical protein
MIETLVILGVMMSMIINGWENRRMPQPIFLWMGFAAIAWLVVTGLLVPNAGAIVRYRSIALPFLMMLILHSFPPEDEPRFLKENIL